MGLEINNLIKDIIGHDNIVIFRHAFPDGDALGSQ
jgi:nanoRNase/pAp phosphatase (c-di-AMP/oligoRNAs hydrolase)